MPSTLFARFLQDYQRTIIDRYLERVQGSRQPLPAPLSTIASRTEQTLKTLIETLEKNDPPILLDLAQEVVKELLVLFNDPELLLWIMASFMKTLEEIIVEKAPPELVVQFLVSLADLNRGAIFEVNGAIVQSKIDAQKRGEARNALLADLYEELRRTKEYLEKVVEEAPIGITCIDREGRFLTWNRGAEEIYGYSNKETIGKTLFSLTIPPDRLEEGRALFERVLQGETLRDIEVERMKKNGTRITLNLSASPLRSAQGEVIGALGISRDITQQKAMEAALIQAEKLRALGVMASGVAHDFNNLLAGVLGYAQLLQITVNKLGRIPVVDDLQRGLHTIEKLTKNGAELVRRLQSFAQTRQDQQATVIDDVNTLISEAVSLAKPSWEDLAQREGRTIKVHLNLGQIAPIQGNPAELREVFLNLLLNAADAMPNEGTIVLPTAKDEERVMISVSDTGIGMHREIQSRIFEPFFTTKGPQHSGLGLSMSYGIIRRHGGTITVNSEIEQGTTITLKLPIMHVKKEEPFAERREPATQVARILVIDDKEMVREVLKEMLCSVGHRVYEANSGQSGLELLEHEPVDLVFTDLGMPNMNGFELAKQVKVRHPEIPVLLVTGWGAEVDARAVKESGIVKVIPKPFHYQEVLSIVQEIMRVKRIA